MKSWSKNQAVKIRNPNSTRPWQHVLEVIRGYIQCAILGRNNAKINGEIFNFGPLINQDKSVIQLINQMRKNWKKVKWKIKKEKGDKKESKLLKLNSLKAKKILKWEPVLSFQKTVEMTALWYKAFYNKKNCFNLSKEKIEFYEKKLKKLKT